MTLPLGFHAATDNWNEAFAHRPMELRDWNQLTFGEQARYARAECRTKGAIYKSEISANRVSFTVELPASLTLRGITGEDASLLERQLHFDLEKRIADMLQHRALLAMCAEDAA